MLTSFANSFFSVSSPAALPKPKNDPTPRTLTETRPDGFSEDARRENAGPLPAIQRVTYLPRWECATHDATAPEAKMAAGIASSLRDELINELRRRVRLKKTRRLQVYARAPRWIRFLRSFRAGQSCVDRGLTQKSMPFDFKL